MCCQGECQWLHLDLIAEVIVWPLILLPLLLHLLLPLLLLLHLPLLLLLLLPLQVLTHCSQLFPTVDYGYTCVPSYPSGQLGLLLCSKDGGQGALTPRWRHHFPS